MISQRSLLVGALAAVAAFATVTAWLTRRRATRKQRPRQVITETIKHVSLLPTTSPPHPGVSEAWDEVALGVATDAHEVFWNVSSAPHMLLTGPSGSGKSVTQRTILYHALGHAQRWDVVGIDLKGGVELGWLRGYSNVRDVAMDLESAVEALQTVRDEMLRRFEEMHAAGRNHFTSLPTPAKSVLVVVDEAYPLLAPQRVMAACTHAPDSLHARATSLLTQIARLGRAAGMHLVLGTQGLRDPGLPPELKANCGARIVAGRVGPEASRQMLGSELAAGLPPVKGRAVFAAHGEATELQVYYVEPRSGDTRAA